MTSKLPVIISGAGLVGSLLAASLAKRGFAVEVYERRSDIRKESLDAGRSINLAMSVRGLTALKDIGIEQEIRQLAIPLAGRMMHSPEGELSYHQYSHDPTKDTLFSISRSLLNKRLVELAAKDPRVSFHFDHRCTSMDLRSKSISFVNQEGKSVTAQGQTVLATDGAYSAVRQSMVKTDRYDYSQSYIEHGYKELHIPPGKDGKHQLERGALHIWPRGSFMMIALPNLDGSFTCTLFFPFEGPESIATLTTREKVAEFFDKYFKDAVPLMPTLLDDYFHNPTASLVTVRCFPWSIGGDALLLGDAAHAIVPFYGQGMNAGFEDIHLLGQLLDRHVSSSSPPDWSSLFAAFQAHRKPDADAIADLALENFIEMRDSVANKDFLFGKQVEHLLEEKFPERYVSQYELISFTTRRYSEARKRGRINAQILADLTRDAAHDIANIDLDKADKLIAKHLDSLPKEKEI
eukprot:TRINITY_DN2914_c0_g1_i1.p1 TRINITY_DN2914_c0_g1~~TRINITY_DN2914_c0_g1_i1.p1  ORF type:complete len:492 (-),score=88.83 TRINITY_DN2914_c0_g1_i1:29-1420(-)